MIYINFSQILIDIHQLLIDIHQLAIDTHQLLIDIHQLLIDIHQLLMDTGPVIVKWHGKGRRHFEYNRSFVFRSFDKLKIIKVIKIIYGWK